MLRLSKLAQLGSDHTIRKEARRDIFERLNTAWSILVRRRDKKCAWCGTWKRLQAHHVVARGIANNRGHIETANGMALCYACHIHRLKRDPDGYCKMRDKWLAARGLSYLEMQLRYASTGGATCPKYDNAELEAMVLQLERQAHCGPRKARKAVDGIPAAPGVAAGEGILRTLRRDGPSRVRENL
jgi:hypothetical protein